MSLQSSIQETINDAVDCQLFNLKYNLNNLIGGMLFSVNLELENKGHVMVIDNIVRQLFNSTHREGPEGEDWPAWDQKPVQKEIEALEKVLREHGIFQHHNYVSNQHKKKGKKK